MSANKPETRRVSNQVLAWLEDPSSIPEGITYCGFCNSPKPVRNTRCEVCLQKGGDVEKPRKPVRNTNVYVEES